MTTTTDVRPGDGVHLPLMDGDHVVKATVHGPDGAFEVFEVDAAAGPAAPPHVSPWTGVLYVLGGSVTARVDGRTFEVEPGGLVTLPAGTPCTFAVRTAPARFLAMTSGDRASRFFADVAASVATHRPVEESVAAVRSVAARHGVVLAGG